MPRTVYDLTARGRYRTPKSEVEKLPGMIAKEVQGLLSEGKDVQIQIGTTCKACGEMLP